MPNNVFTPCVARAVNSRRDIFVMGSNPITGAPNIVFVSDYIPYVSNARGYECQAPKSNRSKPVTSNLLLTVVPPAVNMEMYPSGYKGSHC